ncbi:glycosyltransferase family 39 protein [Alphaproteobacteria bacterium]|nr:glycosyltransferase family 39 protein [Alphaproteobacteria bacterium]
MTYLNILDYKYFNIKILLGSLCLICFFISLNILPPLDRDESRYIQSTIQMLESNDFVNINFLDTPRLKKPPGIYWLQAMSATFIKNIFFLDSPPLWSFRLPSAIGASVSIWITFLLGQLLFGRAQGFIASLLLISSPLLIIESHIAKTDSALLASFLFVLYILAKIIFYIEKNIKKPSDISILAAWVVLSFSFLIKGPIALFILFLLILFLRFSKEPINYKAFKPVIGIVIFIIIVFPWFMFVQSGNNTDIFLNSIKKDMLLKLISVQESHGAPPGSYLLSSFLTAWPITLFIFPTVIWVFNNKKNKPVKFLLCSLLPSWLFFEIMPTKLLHYILPLLPSLAILTAAMIVSSIKDKNFIASLDKHIFRLVSILPFIGGLLIAFGIIYLANIYGEGLTFSIIIIASIYTLGSFLSAYYIYTQSFINTLIVVVFSNIIALNLLILMVPNQLQKIWVSERVYLEIEEKTVLNEYVLLGYSEPSLIYRLGSKTKIAGNSEEAISLVLNSNIQSIIIENSYLREFKDLSDKKGIVFRSISKPIVGFNYSKGENVEIIIIKLN